MFDSSTLEQAYEGSHPLIDHRRQKRTMEIALRMVNKDGINRGFIKFSYPLRARYSEAPVFIQQIPTRIVRDADGNVIGLSIKLRWEAPNLIAFPIILGYQYRWGYAPARSHNFGQWINNGKERELEFDLPSNVNINDEIDVQIRIVTKSDRTLTHNEFAGGEVARDFGEIAEFRAQAGIGGSLLPPGVTGPQEFTGEIPVEDTKPDFAGQRIMNILAEVNEPIPTIRLPVAQGGNGEITYSIPSPLPTGLTFNPVTRELSGTPTRRQGGLTYVYRATDEDEDTDTLTFSIRVNAPVEEVDETLTKAETLAKIKNVDNWRVVATGSRTYQYVDGGTATIRQTPSDTMVIFMSVPTLTSPLYKTVRAATRETILTAALDTLSSEDQV